MKTCPQCGREYDNSMMFCLDDGVELLYGPAAIEEPATAIFSHGGDAESPVSAESLTKRQSLSAPRTEPQGGISGYRAAESHTSVSDHRAAKLIPVLIGLGILVLLAGYFGYLYLSPVNSKQIESIAVMPFVNDSRNADIEYLSDGMTETLISSLTKLPNLNVKARSSVFRYKGKETDVKTLGRELNVQAILNGHVAQRGDQLTLNLELVDVATENAIWSQQYTRTQTDIVSLQSQIAKEVSARLKTKLSGAEETTVAKSATADPEAYEAYLKGRFYWNQRGQGPGKMEAAIENLRTAVSKDPNYAVAYAGLADCYVLMPQETGAPPGEALTQAKAYANRALEIDESMSEAHATLGLINQTLWQWSDAKKEFERSIELNPNYPTAHQWYAHLLGDMGQPEQRFAEIRKAYDLDPLSPSISTNLGLSQLERGDTSSAVEQFNRTLDISPNFFVVHTALAMAYLKLGKTNEARLAAEKSVELSHRHGYALSVLGHVRAVLGDRNGAVAFIKEIEGNPHKAESDEYFISTIYAGLGEKDQAFAWLEKSFQQHNTFLTNLRIDPLLDSLRDELRYKDLIRRMGLPV